ncbi:fungal-specific transcription factor domain-containing protein [Amylocarpus encephaloides]|uniref:Fungal-specific transcription factor domain-containing protein n=1 Tax=Amylocarpus encephaloides TaxID=45428 RepID=A0A9P7YJL3_9HELO|nr:fungal-specific transcription factor domain-containing protein [Amylocarpus encephaloides]
MDFQSQSRRQSRPRDGPPRKLCKRIKRVRTGCQTCKKRRKKCDEARPYCQICARANYQCPRLPAARVWEETRPGTVTRPVEQFTWTNQTRSPPSENECQSFDALQSFDSVRFWPHEISTTGDSSTINASPSYEPLVQEDCCDLRGLLFCHFIQDMSHVLTISSTDMVEVIRPYAELDEAVKSALLSLAASHLLNTGAQESRKMSITRERDDLHQEAVCATQRHLRVLQTQQLSLGNGSLSSARLDSAFLSCLLLCVFEICEGNVDDTSIRHLSTAREGKMASVSNQKTITKRLYQKDLYIWLLVIWFSLISHDVSHIADIQDLVKKTLTDISQIAHNDPVLTSLLFPLFIIGGTASDPEDRTVVRKQFQKLKKWTCFGNVDRALSVVKEMWRNHDLGQLESWDWVL